MTTTLKNETIGKYYVDLALGKDGIYEVIMAYECGAGYRTEKSKRTIDKKSATTTYNYYRRLARKEM